MLAQQIPKREIERLVHELPDMIDVEDMMYRLYLFQKIQDGERDIQAGHILSHAQVLERLSKKWRN
jgi:hypothetical protein